VHHALRAPALPEGAAPDLSDRSDLTLARARDGGVGTMCPTATPIGEKNSLDVVK